MWGLEEQRTIFHQVTIFGHLFVISYNVLIQISYFHAKKIQISLSSPEPKARVSYCHSAPSVVPPSVVVRPSANFSHFQLLLLNRLMDFGETWKGWSIYGPLLVLFFSASSALGRIQGAAKIGHGGPLLQRMSSSDQKATATNPMHGNDLEACGRSVVTVYREFFASGKFGENDALKAC